MTREQFEDYVRWNQCSRHQLIVAHMTLINEMDMQKARLAGAVELPATVPFDQIVSEAIAQLADCDRPGLVATDLRKSRQN